MTDEDVPEGSKGEVWMLDTFGNVHSLVNACKQLGFKVNRITSPRQLESATVPPFSILR
jgi:S-adenosylmethionine hydrolase